MPSTTHADFDADQDFESVKDAIKLIHAQANSMASLKAVVCANIDRDKLGFAAELLHAYHPACALDDPKFREQMRGLRDISDTLNGTQDSVGFSTDPASVLLGSASEENASSSACKVVMAGSALFLNRAQIEVLLHYSDGEFKYFLDTDDEDQFDGDLENCGDTLLKFLILELSTRESCVNVQLAIQRVFRAIRQLHAVASNLESLPDQTKPFEAADAPATRG